MDKTGHPASHYLSLVGAFLIEISMGSIFISGNIIPYLSSYLQNQGVHISTSDLHLVPPLQALTFPVFFSFCPYLLKNYHPKVIAFFAMATSLILLILLPFLKNLYLISLVYGALLGASIGLQYLLVVIISWSHFPNSKGKTSGLILSAFGLGTSLFNPVSTYLINPSNAEPTLKIGNGMYFEKEISDRFPYMIFCVAAIAAIINTLGILLLGKMENNESGSSGLKKSSVLMTVKTGNFWKICGMVLLSNSGAFYMFFNYKTYGREYIKDDMFLALVGSVGTLFDGCFRIVWGLLMDRYSFKVIYGSLVSIEFILLSFIPFAVNFRYLYLITAAVLICFKGGHFVVFSTFSVKVYGSDLGPKLFSIFSYFLTFGSLFSSIIHRMIVPILGIDSVFYVLSGLVVFSILLLLSIEENNTVKENELALINHSN